MTIVQNSKLYQDPLAIIKTFLLLSLHFMNKIFRTFQRYKLATLI